MTPTNQPDSQDGDELDSLLNYIQIQFRKPIPSDIREEVVAVGDLIVLEEARAAIDAYAERLATERAVKALETVKIFVESESGKSGRKAIIGFIKSEQRITILTKEAKQ